MKKFFAIIVVASMAACVRQAAIEPRPLPEGPSIGFGGGVAENPVSPIQPGNDGAPDHDLSGIQVLRGAVDGPTPNFPVSQRLATATMTRGSTRMTLSPKQYFGTDHLDAHFTAYYPAPDSRSGGVMSYTIDGTQDIMAAAPQTTVYARGGATVDFRFDHLLSWLQLKVVAANDATVGEFGKLTEATIKGIPTQLELTLDAAGNATLAKKTGSDTEEMNFVGANGIDFTTQGVTAPNNIMVFPDNSDVTHITIGFEKRAAREYAIEGLDLRAGEKNVITATVTAYAITFTVSAEAWKDGGTTIIPVGGK